MSSIHNPKIVSEENSAQDSAQDSVQDSAQDSVRHWSDYFKNDDSLKYCKFFLKHRSIEDSPKESVQESVQESVRGSLSDVISKSEEVQKWIEYLKEHKIPNDALEFLEINSIHELKKLTDEQIILIGKYTKATELINEMKKKQYNLFFPSERTYGEIYRECKMMDGHLVYKWKNILRAKFGNYFDFNSGIYSCEDLPMGLKKIDDFQLSSETPYYKVEISFVVKAV